MSDKEDYLTSYRLFFENFAATVNPEDQLPVNIIGYSITESELTGEVLYWTTQYLSEKQCPPALMTPLRRIILDEVRVASKKTPNEFGYKSDDSVYIALRLMQAVTARVNAVCLRYLDNSRLDTLPPPPPLAQRDLKTVSCATKNSRRAMEDRHVEIGNLEALFGIETTEPTSFYAVYDGHAGSAAATYAAAHLHQYLVESPHFSTDLRRAMRDAYLRTDAEFIRKSNQERASGGSTAVTVAVRGRRLLAAWAGDSLALLAKRMRLMQLVRPHKPDRQDERERIESSGGTVMYWGTWRVNGQLAVSRAIGDAQYKPYVTARPEIATVDLDGDEDFVVVACDGLWDFVIEDDVALAVYRQIAADPDDLKAITKRLIVQAKRQGSADNISVIVVFLKDPRDIAAENCPPMDLGLDNAMMNAPPFTIDREACKQQDDAAAVSESSDCAEVDAEIGGNGVDNSDSDSEDLGPETAVDADDLDAEARHQEPQPPTPPARTVEESHVDGALLDNVAESGEDSEDEWNYYKGEGEREEQNPSEEPDEAPRSETPCQDNSAWENSSVDMNSSPLNPDAPVFIPGGVAGADVLLAESPRKPLPMDDIELPDVAQFETEAVVRPAELLDLDNCDQLNGHHNISLEAVTEHLNGNDKCNLDSLGFGFNVGIEPDKVKDTGLIQDFERIQKDTTDFCNIQIFQTHQETNPFAVEDNDELFERLKNKERDPMSMSFYQEKDDDTCDRILKNESAVDLNAVQLLPDSDDEDMQTNGVHDEDKENVSPEERGDPFDIVRELQEPNNDILQFDDRSNGPTINNFEQGDNFVDYNNITSSNNIESFTNLEFESSNVIQETTDTPESHKLLFEQIPEIPDGKSSELGFTNDELLDRSESEREVLPFTPQDETSQDIEIDSKQEDSPCVESVSPLNLDPTRDGNEETESPLLIESEQVVSPTPDTVEQHLRSPTPCYVEDIKSSITPEPVVDENLIQDVHSELQSDAYVPPVCEINDNIEETVQETPSIRIDTHHLTNEDTNIAEEDLVTESPLPSKSPLLGEGIIPGESVDTTESPLPSESPLPEEPHLTVDEALPAELCLQSDSPLPEELIEHVILVPESALPMPKESPLPSEPDVPIEHEILPVESPVPGQVALSPAPRGSDLLCESPLHTESPLLTDASLLRESPLPTDSPLPDNASLPRQSPEPTESTLQLEPTFTTAHSPMPIESPMPSDHQIPTESPLPISKTPVEPEFQISESPVNIEFQTAKSPVEIEIEVSKSPEPTESFVPTEVAQGSEQLPTVTDFIYKNVDMPEPQHSSPAPPAVSPLPVDMPLPTQSPLHIDEPTEQRLTAAPDLLPDQPCTELVTDVDIGIPESRAHEICLPVTNEIHLEEVEQPTGVATPPPTPAVEPPAPVTEPASLGDTTAAVVAGAAALGVAAVAAGVAKTKISSATKKSPTTPTAKADARTAKPATKTTTTPRTPSATATAARKPAPASPAARTPTTPKAPTPATRVPSATTRTASAARTSTTPKPPTPVPKSTTPAPKASAVPKPQARAPATARPAPAKTNGVAPKPAAARPAPLTARAVPPTKATPRPSSGLPTKPPAARTEATRVPAARPAPRPAPTRPAPRPAERKPLSNGEVKDSKVPARPATAPATRPAPRPTPRPAAPASAPVNKPSAPKPLPRATPLDKQSKDLANRRITAKAAPPRTAVSKTAALAVKKAVPKKPLGGLGGLTNGSALGKVPPSPPATDATLLPDVIA